LLKNITPRQIALRAAATISGAVLGVLLLVKIFSFGTVPWWLVVVIPISSLATGYFVVLNYLELKTSAPLAGWKVESSSWTPSLSTLNRWPSKYSKRWR